METEKGGDPASAEYQGQSAYPSLKCENARWSKLPMFSYTNVKVENPV